MSIARFFRPVLKIGQAIGRHPVVGLLETASVVGGAAKFALDTDIGKRAAVEGKALAVSGYEAVSAIGTRLLTGRPAASGAVTDVGTTPAQRARINSVPKNVWARMTTAQRTAYMNGGALPFTWQQLQTFKAADARAGLGLPANSGVLFTPGAIPGVGIPRGVPPAVWASLTPAQQQSVARGGSWQAYANYNANQYQTGINQQPTWAMQQQYAQQNWNPALFQQMGMGACCFPGMCTCCCCAGVMGAAPRGGAPGGGGGHPGGFGGGHEGHDHGGGFGGRGFYNPGAYPGGFDPDALGLDLQRMDPTMFGMDPNSPIDSSLYVQGAFTVAGLPLYLPREAAPAPSGAPAAVAGACSGVGCAAEKPCAPCAAKAAAAQALLGDVAGANEILTTGEAAPGWTPPEEVGQWVPGHWMTDPAGVERWVASHNDGRGARLWRWVRQAVGPTNGQARADGRTYDLEGRQWVEIGRDSTKGGIPVVWDGNTWRPRIGGGAPRAPGRPGAPAPGGWFGRYRSSVIGRINGLRAQLAAAKDAGLRAALQGKVDALTTEHAHAGALEQILKSNASAESSAMQAQLEAVADQPEQMAALIAHLAPQIQTLAPGGGGPVINNTIEVPMSGENGGGSAALVEDMDPQWEADPGSVAIRPYEDDWNSGDPNENMSGSEIADYAMAGGDQSEGEPWSEMNLEGTPAALQMGALWDVPNPDAVAEACDTCPTY